MGISVGPWLAAATYAVAVQFLPCISAEGVPNCTTFTCTKIAPWISHAIEDPIALFTLALTLSTVGLWLQTRRLAQGGEETGRRQLRAYLSFFPETVANFFVGDLLVIHCSIRNHGQTPAFDIQIVYDIDVVENPARRENPPPTSRQGTGFGLAPGSAIGEHFVYPKLTDKERSEISGGTKRLHLWGYVEFTDAFETRRRLCFNLSYSDSSRAVALGRQEGQLNWRYQKRHNCELD